MDEESTISPEDLNRAINDVRENYRKVYGEKALKRAVGIFGNATFIFDGPIDGSKRPTTVKIDNLGIVTIHADGREEYEGPLEKITRK